MLIKLQYLVQKYNLKNKIKGILHIGAHMCEEYADYKKIGLNDNTILWIEGNPQLAEKLKFLFKKRRIINACVSDKDDQTIEFNIANNGQSSSILELGTHKKHHPHVKYTNKLSVKTKTIQTLYKEHNIPHNFANFLNIDIQGAELLALKGMNNLLNNFDYLYLEVNDEELYKGCGLISEIDDYVAQYGFKRIETKMTQFHWGDAFYSRSQQQ